LAIVLSVFFLLAIVLSVLHRFTAYHYPFTASDYPFTASHYPFCIDTLFL
jgi:hypothetical protein